MALSLHYYSYPFTLWYFHYLVKDMSNGILVFATIVLVMLNNTKHFTANINIFESSAIKLVTTVHNSLNNCLSCHVPNRFTQYQGDDFLKQLCNTKHLRCGSTPTRPLTLWLLQLVILITGRLIRDKAVLQNNWLTWSRRKGQKTH